MRRVSFVLTMVGVLALARGADAQTTHPVLIDGIAFVPQHLTIEPGDSVTWENTTNNIHTVTDRTCEQGGACLFDQELSPGDGLGPITFPSIAVINYRCTIHGFTGQIRVDSPDPTASDLTTTKVTGASASAGGVPVPGTTIVDVDIMNLGPGIAPTTTLLVEYRYRARWWSIDEVELPALGPGDGRRLHVLWDTSTKLGDFTVRATPDPAGETVDWRPENNAGQAVVPVLLPAGVIAGGLDISNPLGTP